MYGLEEGDTVLTEEDLVGMRSGRMEEIKALPGRRSQEERPSLDEMPKQKVPKSPEKLQKIEKTEVKSDKKIEKPRKRPTL
jgi:hypothetical protein